MERDGVRDPYANFNGDASNVLRGGPEPPPGECDEPLVGSGRGDDLRGGPASELLLGLGGDDRIFSVGQGRERVDCGSGEDRARIGRADRAVGCEHVRRG